MKRLILITISILLSSLSWAADQNIYISSSAATGGDGSITTPYDEFADINWTTGGTNSIFDWVAAGDDVYINLKRGSIWYEELTCFTGGVSGHPVTIQPYGTGDKPIIDGGGTDDRPVNTYTQDYLTFDGLEVRNGTQYGVYFNSAGTGHGILKNSTIHSIDSGTDGDGVRIASSNNLVDNCVIYNNGDDGISLPAAANAVDNTISNCNIYGNDQSSAAGDAIEVKDTNHRTIIQNNTLDIPDTCVKQSVILDSDNNVVENNTISGGLVGVRCSNNGTGSIIRYNKFQDINYDTTSPAGGSRAVVLDSAVPAKVYGNTFSNCRTVIASLGAATLEFYGNTIFGAGTWAVYIGDSATILSKNNIINGTYDKYIYVSNVSTTYTASYNNYYPDFTDMFSYGGSTYSTVATFVSAASETNSIDTDPEIVSQGKLKKDSPAISTGIQITGINDSNEEDIWGNVTYNPPNIGAYQGYGVVGGGGTLRVGTGGSGLGVGLGVGLGGIRFSGGGWREDPSWCTVPPGYEVVVDESGDIVVDESGECVVIAIGDDVGFIYNDGPGLLFINGAGFNKETP